MSRSVSPNSDRYELEVEQAVPVGGAGVKDPGSGESSVR